MSVITPKFKTSWVYIARQFFCYLINRRSNEICDSKVATKKATASTITVFPFLTVYIQ